MPSIRNRGQPGWKSRYRHLALGVLIASTASTTVTGCGDNVGDSTSQHRVTLQTQVRVPQEAKGDFVNGYGWSIKLSEAALAMGPLYYFEGEPVLVFRRTPHKSLWARAYDWLVPDAAAHPGHYQSGDAMGQMLETTSVDLLATPAALPAGDGVTGTFRSASFFFASPASTGASNKLSGATAVVGGKASKDNVTLTFHGAVKLDDLLNYEQKPSVIGCAFEPYADISNDTTITVTIDPRLWLDQVDFAELSTAGGNPTVQLAPGTIAHKALVRGMKKGGGYRFSVIAHNN